jgi:hypothetical protein
MVAKFEQDQARFEEKQYETAANNELGQHSRNIYSAGQVAEAILAFDVAAYHPLPGPLWQLLGILAPLGVQLVPTMWPLRLRPGPDVGLPSYVVSLVLQYKRSDFLTRSNASQYAHWRRNYYRFGILDHQHQQLIGFEASVSAAAVVRYAAPVFWKYVELEAHQRKGKILENSNFVSPASLGGSHQVWTYVEPGIRGWANPDGEELPAESWSGIEQSLGASKKATTVLEHLRAMAESLRSSKMVRPSDEFEPNAVDMVWPPVSEQAKKGLVNFMTVAQVLGRSACSWWMYVVPAQ